VKPFEQRPEYPSMIVKRGVTIGRVGRTPTKS
jgi:hypothetical protein